MIAAVDTVFTVNRRTLVLLALLAVPLFYAVGTGFDFLYKLLYAVLLLFAVGAGWAWVNLRGLQVRVTRSGDRGQVGTYLEGRVTVTNNTVIPKSWLEVTELTGSSPQPGGRGLALDRRQTRGWRIETYLSRRGLFEGGHMRIVSQDPFGLFRMGRDFSDPHTYIVYPAVEPLPNLDSRFAGLPSDSRLTRHYDQVTTDVASLRDWRPGDAYRRIHWPYTARMNRPMVKEFDVGLAAQFWVLLDLQRLSHYYPVADGRTENRTENGDDNRREDRNGHGGQENGRRPVRPEYRAENTEELAVTVAASLAQRLMDLSLPVGMAVNGEDGRLLRPDNGPDHLSRIMETLASVTTANVARLPEFLYSMRPHLNHLHSVTVITTDTDPSWLPALLDLKRLNVSISIIMVDPSTFGSRWTTEMVTSAAAAELIPVYVVGRDSRLDASLSRPVNRETIESVGPIAVAGAALLQEAVDDAEDDAVEGEEEAAAEEVSQ